MKTKLLIPIALLFALSAKAQKADTARVLVRYKFIHVRDTTKRDTPYVENMMLLIGQNASVYKSFDKQAQMELMKKKMAEMMKNPQPGPMNFSTSSKRTTPTEIFQYPNEKKQVRKEKLINDYLISEPLADINWKISSDTASFGELHCQKATAHFKGRNYIAWFCPDLPFRSGPWKLNGLPGLIVDAHDVKNEVIFKFDGVEQVVKNTTPKTEMPENPNGPHIVTFGMDDPNADPNVIKLPTAGIPTTDKEFAGLQEAMKKDPEAFVKSMMAGSGATMRPVAGAPMQVIKIKAAPAEVINNPIELPEKK